MRGFNYKKAVQVLNLIASRSGGTANKMKAIKLIWLADRLHLRSHGRTITGDTYFALPNGPVPSATRDLLEYNSFALTDEELGYSSSFIAPCKDDRLIYKSNNEIDDEVFSETELKVIDEVLNAYGNLNQFKLRDLSHEFPEWKKHESALNSKIASRFLMDMEDFFKDASPAFEKFQIDPEILEGSKEVYLHDVKIANMLK